MPAIYLFQKRTLLGGDDLQLPALVTMGVRLVQFFGLVLPLCLWMLRQASVLNSSLLDYVLTDPSSEEPCRHSHFFPLLTTMHLGATVVFTCISLILEQRIWHWTCQGTPTQRQPRSQTVEALLECKLFVMTVLLVLIVLTYISATVFAKQYVQCHRVEPMMDDMIMQEEGGTSHEYVGTKAWWVCSGLLVLSQLAEIAVAVLFWWRVVWSRHNHHSHASAQSQLQHHSHELTEELWADRCHFFCQCLSVSTCCLFGGQDLVNNPNAVPYYEHVARALADYLETRGTLDIVPTDLVAGLLVLQRLQRQRILQARLQVVRSSHSQRQSMVRAHQQDPSSSSILASNSNSTAERQRSTLRLRTSSSDDLQVSAPEKAPTSAPLIRDLQSNMGSGPSTTNRGTTLTQRSRVGSTNDLRQKTSNAHFAAALPQGESRSNSTKSSSSTMGITNNSSAGSLDLPETTRLVGSLGNDSPQQQRIFRRRESETTRLFRGYQPLSRQVLNPHNPVDCQRLQEGARMAKYALAIYTWMLYVFVHPVTGLPRLLFKNGCKLCGGSNCCGHNFGSTSNDTALLEEGAVRRHSTTTVGDNFCQWHKHALLLVAGLNECDLVHAQFVNRVSLTPYCILLDHDTQSVVVCIRGSLSLEDIVTDVSIDPEPLQEFGENYGFDATGQYCHAGVVECAQNIYQELQRLGLLEQLLQHEYPNYSLKLVGHSLGAATCTLLGYMLQPRYPSLRVFNFSPPGCTMTWDLATRCESWTTTFVLDSDIVPRLSVSHLEGLRDEVLQLIGQLKVPKYQVVQTFWKSRRSCWFGSIGESIPDASWEDHHSQLDLQDLTEVIGTLLDDTPAETSYNLQLQEFLQVQQERKQSRGALRTVELYPPGRMIHLLKTGEEGGCGHVMRKTVTCCTSNSGFHYTPVYIANDDLDEIVVSPTMGTDHFIDRMKDELSTLAEEFDFCHTESGGELV